MKRFAEQVIWITGASSGIGLEMARAFVKEGAKVVMSGRSQEKLQELSTELGLKNTLALPLDITKHSTIAVALQQVVAGYGRIDVLINNAGITQRSLAVDTTMQVYREIMETNFFGAVAMTQAVLPQMIHQGGGHIVTTSSVVGKYGAPNRAGYSAAKHALHGYFDSLRPEVKSLGIQITLLVVGAVKTDISAKALTGNGRPLGKRDVPDSSPEPKDIVGDIISGLAAGRREVIVGHGPEIEALSLKRLDQEKFFDLVEERASKPLWENN